MFNIANSAQRDGLGQFLRRQMIRQFAMRLSGAFADAGAGVDAGTAWRQRAVTEPATKIQRTSTPVLTIRISDLLITIQSETIKAAPAFIRLFPIYATKISC